LTSAINSDRLTLFFLPREWQETFSAPGYMFLAGIVAFEVFCLTTRYKSLKLDYWAHLGGYFSGVTSAALLLSRSHKPEARRGRRRRQQGDKDQDNWFKAAISKIFRIECHGASTLLFELIVDVYNLKMYTYERNMGLKCI